MERRSFMLAAMSPAGSDSFYPVQVQKLFFLLDENIPGEVDGPHFRFEPYDYGPFDKNVYSELEAMRQDDFVEIFPWGRYGGKIYKLTNKGREEGKKVFESISELAQEKIQEAVEFVRTRSFSQLVSEIYKRYPAMRENSVFVEKTS